MVLKEWADLASSRRADRSTVSPCQVPAHVMHFLAFLYKNAMLLELCQHIRLSQWSETWRRRLYSKHMETIPVQHMSTQGIKVKNLTIRHADAGRGLFASQTIWKR